MLHIRMLSGEEVASIPVGELTDVKELKRHLHQLHSYPPRFRQRLLLGGNPMDDSAKLDSPMDLDLVSASILRWIPDASRRAGDCRQRRFHN